MTIAKDGTAASAKPQQRSRSIGETPEREGGHEALIASRMALARWWASQSVGRSDNRQRRIRLLAMLAATALSLLIWAGVAKLLLG